MFCIQGNHEQRPFNIETYEEIEMFGAKVYIEKEFNGVKTSDIDKYKMEEFENMDFIGWLIKSGEMGDYLEWRSEKTDLGGCIIQVDEGKVNPKVFEKMLENENIRELNIKFRR